MQLPVEHSAPDGHEKSRYHMILNESTEGSAILWHQILVMGRDWNEGMECVRVCEWQSFLQIDIIVTIKFIKIILLPIPSLVTTV